MITGTVIEGQCRVNSELFVHGVYPCKVKSIQKFHNVATEASAGDRVGICIGSFQEVTSDSRGGSSSATGEDGSGTKVKKKKKKKIEERGIVCSKGVTCLSHSCIALVHRVKFFKRPCKSNSKG